MFSIDYHPYTIDDIDTILDNSLTFIKNNKQIEYLNAPATIDIESSSFYENGYKRAIMYSFVIGINGKGIIARTYNDLNSIISKIVNFYKLSKNRRIIFYIHNLEYEFQFFRKRFQWEKVFAIEPRRILYALTTSGVELRCSYMLSGYSLEYIGKHILNKYHVEKLVGALDYSKIRHSETPLTQDEVNYQLNDGLVVMAYIQERIEEYKNNISYLPLTKTGKVRELMKKNCLYRKKHHQRNRRFINAVHSINILSVQEYQQLKRGFQGGFTHANGHHVNQCIKNVTSMDISSSYPSVLVLEEYPMGNGELVKIKSLKDMEEKMQMYCCLFDATFINLDSSTSYEHPISSSKCWELKYHHEDNGRIISAEKLTITLTEQDFYIIREFYKWDKLLVANFRIYMKNYLPYEFVMTILELYKNKTELKGVEEQYLEYMNSKENVNSCYGMSVTDICRDELEYLPSMEDVSDDTNGGWLATECDYQKALDKYNKNPRRVLAYQWGVWVTAYARRNLFRAIQECKDDYVYSDTDSVKFIHAEKHQEFFKKYNANILKKIDDACAYHNISREYFSPKTIKGDTKTIGVFELDGVYQEFKTLGAKRYMVKTAKGFEYKGEHIPYSLTISGLSKFTAIPYLYHKYGDNIMSAFKDGMYIPKEYTGKNTHTYLDFYQSGEVIDYNGVKGHYEEMSSTHLEEAEYELSMTREFLDFLLDVQQYIQ